MKTDFLLAITQLAAERNLPKEVVFAAVEAALVTAFKKDEEGARQDISVKIHPASGDVKVYITKVVVEEVTDSYKEISLAEAKKIKKDVKVGETVTFESASFQSGRIAAQTAKQVVLQRLREAEREFIFGEYADREGDIISGAVQRIEPRQVIIDLGKAEGVLPPSEQVRGERYRIGQRLKLYLLEVNKTNKGPRLILSRSHPNLVRRLFELEVPEIYNGNVELKAVAREPGYRSKVAVAAKMEGLDPVGSCVGLRGVRIQNVVKVLNGERIDVIQWDGDPKVFIANALSPAQVVSVDINGDGDTAVVVVPDNQLSLAIGKEGQNARLAARISGWRIDIKSASAAEVEKAALAEKEAEKAVTAEEKVVEKEKPLAAAVHPEQYDRPLEQLGLSSRTFNLLLGGGIKKIGQLLDRSDKDLLAIKGFGNKALEEVKGRLESLELLPQPGGEEIEVSRVSVEEEVELAGEIVSEEEEVEEELIPYKAPPEAVEPAGKPQLRFAEDIFATAEVGSEGGKKAKKDKKKKKKTSREERLEDAKARRGRKVANVVVEDEYEDVEDEYEDVEDENEDVGDE